MIPTQEGGILWLKRTRKEEGKWYEGKKEGSQTLALRDRKSMVALLVGSAVNASPLKECQPCTLLTSLAVCSSQEGRPVYQSKLAGLHVASSEP